MCAQNFSFVVEVSQNGVFSSSLAFSDKKNFEKNVLFTVIFQQPMQKQQTKRT